MTINAMKDYSYNEHKKLKKSNVSSCRILLALLLLFGLSNYVAVGGALYRGFFDVLNKPLTVFIFMNFIIVTLCLVPTQKQMRPTVVYPEIDDGSNCGSPDVVDYSLPYGDEEHTEEENIPVDKHIILVENASGELVAVSSGEGSQSFKRNHHRHHELELRRLERGMSRELAITMREPPWRSSPMDDMSNEEFRLAIETFISQRNKVMIEENMHDEEMMHFLISTSH